MRSNQIRNINRGIQQAQPSAKTIVGRDMDRSSLFAYWCASMVSSAHSEKSMRGWLEQLTLATRVVVTRVTSGALHALATQRSRRHAMACCPAAR